MNTIKQYRPAFFSGFEQEVVSFSTTDEMLATPFVASFRDLEGFYR